MSVGSRRKWLSWAIGVVLVPVALVPFAVTWIERRQARDLRTREPYRSPAVDRQARTAVVYFSRSGNTALAARHMARRVDAALFELDAPAYRLGLQGWARAMLDARGHGAEITPRRIDLSLFDVVYLGSPIWLYSPAPPVWNFVEHNRFDGKRVVLFNTFNSQFEPEYIEAFKSKVMKGGARSFEHRFVRRGRMTQQISPDEMVRVIESEWFIEDTVSRLGIHPSSDASEHPRR
jgi:flavodoxin